jgi:hypothetical protein
LTVSLISAQSLMAADKSGMILMEK